MSYRICAFIIPLLLLISIQSTLGVFKFSKVSCTVLDKSLISVSLCKLKAINRNVAEFTYHGFLKAPVQQAHVHLELFRKYTIYRPFFVNSSIDGCEFMKNRDKYPIHKLFYNAFALHSNVNHSCPYEGDIIIEKFAPDIQIPLPSAEYLLKTNWITNGKTIVNVNVWFMFQEAKKN